MLDFLIAQHSQWILFRGLAAAFALAMPINVFVAIMGGSSPDSKGFFYSLGVVLGIELLSAGSFLLISRVVDCLLVRGFAWNTFSYSGILVASVFFIIGFNIFVDNGFQFIQGNYAISLYGVVALLLFWTAVIVAGRWIGTLIQ